MSGLLGVHVRVNELGALRSEQALTGFTRNDYAPDICFWRADKAATFDADTIIYPVPDLIVEVLSPSTARHDRGVKFEDYAAHGFGEYWIVDPDLNVIEQYLFAGGRFELHAKLAVGATVTSRAVAGFTMPVAAAFDDAANVATLWQLRPQ